MTRGLPVLSYVAGFLLLASTPSAASGLFVGFGGGQATFTTEVDVSGKPKQVDDSAKAWKVFGGASERFYAVEGGYRDFGTVKASALDYKAGTKAWDVAGLGRLRIPILDLFVKAGAMWWSRDTTIGGVKDNMKGTDFFWGVGAGLHVGPLGARVEWERVQLASPDKLSMVSVSGTLGF